MQVKNLIFRELERVPEKNEMPVASETSFHKHWLRPEEDKAWQDL